MFYDVIFLKESVKVENTHGPSIPPILPLGKVILQKNFVFVA